MKVPFEIADLVRWTSGRLWRGDPQASLRGVSIDSRNVEAGGLFVAIVGPNHDGHRFCDTAAETAACLLVERGREESLDSHDGVAIVSVQDTTRALGALGAGHRATFSGPVIGITGSNGKTTTKEMCASILAVASPCHRTPGNLNNQFGLPLTLLGRDERDRTMVVELGMNHRGEIAELVKLARPSVAVITNVGSAHIEHLGSREEIAREKGDIVATLPPEATAVLNADDAAVMSQAGRTAAKVLTFGTSSDADVHAIGVSDLAGEGYAFDLVTPSGTTDAMIKGLGQTALLNALAASAAALAAGASLPEIATGLANHQPIVGRLQQRKLAGDILLVDDTYNANPQSTEAALRMLAARKGAQRALAVLGDMGELGDASEAAHREAGTLAAKLGIDFLITLGERAESVAAGALDSGMQPARVVVAHDHDDAGARANAIIKGRDVVLVKGSRSMHMERIVDAIVARAGYADPEHATAVGDEGA
jgi:UDP-N-acetylmuramoyl-tripeptide--D-alanyl-D-alanine ligase